MDQLTMTAKERRRLVVLNKVVSKELTRVEAADPIDGHRPLVLALSDVLCEKESRRGGVGALRRDADGLRRVGAIGMGGVDEGRARGATHCSTACEAQETDREQQGVEADGEASRIRPPGKRGTAVR